MSDRDRATAAQLYQTDLERHLFATASRTRRPWGRSVAGLLGERLWGLWSLGRAYWRATLVETG